MSAPDPTTLVLPSDLRPTDGRFGSGPSKVRTEALTRLAATGASFLGTSHRRDGVKSVVRRVREGLAEVFSLPADYEVVLGNGGSTALWDALAFGMVEERAEHVVIGEFSSKFAEVTRSAPFLADPVVVRSEPGTRTAAVPDPSVDLYALIHNETSTGVMCEVVRPEGVHGVVAVDATSGAGALRVDPTQFDCYYFAPQKAFGSDGGLWIALCSPAAVDRIARVSGSGRWIPPSLDLTTAVENSRLDQTYNTPALATLFLLCDTVEWINAEGGLAWSTARCDRSAEILYGWAEERPFVTPFVAEPAARSHANATLEFSGVDATALSAALRANGVVDVEPYRKIGANQLRVALFPTVEPDDVGTLTRALDFLVDALS
ncbi:MAG: phosphoserine transaminase [Actinomycetes bacterium]